MEADGGETGVGKKRFPRLLWRYRNDNVYFTLTVTFVTYLLTIADEKTASIQILYR